MKRFAAVSLAALMLLTVFASAASAADVIEIRGPVYNGSDINNIIDTYGENNALTIDATKFAAFYYDIDDNVTTETLSILAVPGTEGNVIGEGGIVYETTIQQVDYEFYRPAAGWSNYSLIGFFAEKYIPINPDKADKLAKLVLDSDDKYTIRTGEQLDLGEGYAIEAKQVDVDGEKVWLEFTKDGEFVDDEIISVVSGSDNTWEVELDDIQDEDDVVVLRVHVNQVFQGAVDSIAQIEGLWLIDYTNAMKIESDDEFGNLDNVKINGDTLTITNEDTFTLTRDDEEEIAEGLFFKTADDTRALRFYAMKQITEPGTYEIRGEVAEGDFSWDATNFAGFFYDVNDDVSTESLTVTGLNGGNVIPEGGLVYETTIQMVDYEYSKPSVGWDQFPVVGFFAEEYIPINPDKADKLAKLVLDSNQVFQGAVDSIAQIEGIWLIDYANAMTIESDDEFGDLDNVKINGATLTITNEDTFTLTRDDEVEIGQGMFFKVADTAASDLRYYPFVEKTIGGEVVDDDEDDDNVTEPVDNDTEVEEPTEGPTEEPTEGPTTEEPTFLQITFYLQIS
ncbi:hypothetical protein MmTuc01_2057 [Methanosarcina mazei Tuc01]|uniref:S-layer family duplication domain-containing protein n=1 Tax=Methanosarcina mazei Tuc01 TaxID=1236903 RepID=M1QK97_METMZ|nr:hypothetical protein MmTuc01_2057 [Methanosarcina mazei Tuc01]